MIGAGSSAERIIREIRDNRGMKFVVVGILDDDSSKTGATIHSVPILGSIDELPNFNIPFDEIIICETKNKRSMKAEELTKQFNNIEKIKIILSDYDAIEYALKKATSQDSIGIIGTHHLGESISKIFNISFNLL